LPSIAQTNSSCHATLLLAALTTTSNSHELKLTTVIALNFAEDIAIHSPRNFTTVSATVSPSEVAN
jgi:hypothetical protein